MKFFTEVEQYPTFVIVTIKADESPIARNVTVVKELEISSSGLVATIKAATLRVNCGFRPVEPEQVDNLVRQLKAAKSVAEILDRMITRQEDFERRVVVLQMAGGLTVNFAKVEAD